MPKSNTPSRRLRRATARGPSERFHPEILTELRRRQAGGPHLTPSTSEPDASWLTMDELSTAIGLADAIDAGRVKLHPEHRQGLIAEDGTKHWDADGRVTDALHRYYAAKVAPGWPYSVRSAARGDS